MEEKSLELFADEVRQRCEDGISTSSLMQLISDYILQSALDTQKPTGDAEFQNDICGIVSEYGVKNIYDATTEILICVEKYRPKAALTGDCGGGDRER